MKRILLVLVLVLVFAPAAWGQLLIAPVNYVPFVKFGVEFFNSIREWFSDFLKHFWVILLSMFLAWWCFDYVKKMLGDYLLPCRICQECEQLVVDKVKSKEGTERSSSESSDRERLLTENLGIRNDRRSGRMVSVSEGDLEHSTGLEDGREDW